MWLDPARTLPYELHQYFVNVDDRDVERLLLHGSPWCRWTRWPRSWPTTPPESGPPGGPAIALADEVCTLVHGEPLRRPGPAWPLAGLFGREAPTGEVLEALRGIVPETSVTAGGPGGRGVAGRCPGGIGSLCSSKG